MEELVVVSTEVSAVNPVEMSTVESVKNPLSRQAAMVPLLTLPFLLPHLLLQAMFP
jgi:hypothetical protein